MHEKFLEHVLGLEGAKALNKAAERSPALCTVFIPRAIVSWVSTVARISYEGSIPGLDNSCISLTKAENGNFYGAITVDGSVYDFNDVDLMHVSAAVGVALGIDSSPISSELKSQDLSRLGKNIDLLVKFKFVNDLKEDSSKKDTEVEKVELPGQTAAPRGPLKPVPPVAQAKQKNILNRKKSPVLNKFLNITKSEAARLCNHCGLTNFNESEFVGCICFRSLAKNVNTEITNSGYTLVLRGKEWDSDALAVLVAALKE